MRASDNHGRIRIGFQVTHIGDDYCKMFLPDIIDACQRLGADLVILEGGSLFDPHSYDYQRNSIYRYVNRQTIDAMVFLTGTLRNFTTEEEFNSFIAAFSDMRIVSLSQVIPDRVSLYGSNRSGIEDALRHLITFHGRRRIAFICGLENNPDAQERYQAYRETLEACGIPFDPALVCQGDFIARSGDIAVSMLLDERKVAFDAIVGANDNMALAAMQALKARGIRVPGDVSVIGFDDIIQAAYASPPLTTVRQPYRDLARKAIDLAVETYTVGNTAQCSEYRCELVIRSSCGCLPASLLMYDRVAGLVGSFTKDYGKKGFPGYLEAIQKLSRPESLSDLAMTEGLSFLHSLFEVIPRTDDGKRAFLFSVQDFAFRPENDPPCLFFWEQALVVAAYIKGLDNEQDPCLFEAREKARIIIREARMGYHNRRHFRLIEEAEKIQRIVQLLLLPRELSDLYAVIPQIAEMLEISEFFLVIHDTVRIKREELATDIVHGRKLVAAVSEGKAVTRLPLSINDPVLLPEPYSFSRTGHCRVVSPLYALEELYGYACFELGSYSMDLYDSFINELGSVIKRCVLGTKQKWTESKLRAALRKLKETNQKLADLSHKDELTRLYNRRGFLELAQQSLKFSQRMKKDALLIFVDMDGLKRINDTWGHEAGDNAIVAAAIVLKATFRLVDIIARHGGDEFVILTLDSPYETRDIMIERLTRNIKVFNDSNAQQWELSMSVGVVSIKPQDKRSISELITVADGLQYQEKLAKRKTRE